MNNLEKSLKLFKEQGSSEWDQDFFTKSIIPLLDKILENVVDVFDDFTCEEKQITPSWRGIQFDFYNRFDSLEIEFFVHKNGEYAVEYLLDLQPSSNENKYVGGFFVWVGFDNKRIVNIVNDFIMGSYL